MNIFSKRFLKPSIILGSLLILLVSFSAYCVSIFHELEDLMAETPQSPTTVIYAKTQSLFVGDTLLVETLRENLALLKISVKNTSPTQMEWTAPAFPEVLSSEVLQHELYPQGSVFPKLGSVIKLTLSEPVNSICNVLKISVQEADASKNPGTSGEFLDVAILALPPALITQASSDQRTIREYRMLDDIPTPVKNAFIAVEDSRFLQHPGFDFRGLTRAMLVNLRRGAFVQGASTITQQLVKNLLKTHRKTVSRKVKELVLAILMEVKYEKEQILERYLNEVYFGQVGALEVHGVAQAAHYFFGKDLDHLSVGEIAFLAGVVKGPNVYSPYRDRAKAIERKNIVLKKLLEQRYLAQEEYNSGIKTPLEFAAPRGNRNEAPYFTDYIKATFVEEHSEALGLNIFTTLDLSFQNRIQKTVKQQVEALSTRFKHPLGLPLQAALIAANYSTGEILGLVGGRSFEESNYNRILNSRRPVGSTFKPLVYLSAFLKGHDKEGRAYNASYPIEDSSFTWKFDRQVWTPQNYEHKFLGTVTLRDALANSMNVPAARIGYDVGIENIVELSKAMGIGDSVRPVPSSVLGTAELTPLELLQVYSTFANRGEAFALHGIRLVTNSQGNILKEFKFEGKSIHKPVYFDLLKSLLGSVVTEGTAKIMNQFHLSDEVFGKTGTTNDYRDAWFAGFTGPMAMVTWVGFDHYDGIPKNAKLSKLTGAGAALPVWAMSAKDASASLLHWRKPVAETAMNAASSTTTASTTDTGTKTSIQTNAPTPEPSLLEAHWVDLKQNCLVSSAPEENARIVDGKRRFREEVYIPELLPPVCPTK